MPQTTSQDEKEITVADLYPELTSEQQAEAEFYLLGYLDVVRRVFERVCHDHPEFLTELEKTASLKQERLLDWFNLQPLII